MVKKTTTLLLSMLMCMMSTVVLSSCGDDDDPEPSSPIAGTWVCDYSGEDYFDTYTLVFNDDGSGYIINSWGSRTTKQMDFNWSLNATSTGAYRLSVIYVSGDRYIDGPFEGGYAQYNSTVTIAGNILSIQTDDDSVMLFQRQ